MGFDKERLLGIDLIEADTEESLKTVEEIYMEAFPAIERKPFPLLVEAQARKDVEILMVKWSKDGGRTANMVCRNDGTAERIPEESLKDEVGKLHDTKTDILGEIILAGYGDVVLLDYFAIAPAFRGQGIGEKVLVELQKRCKGKRLVLEIESTKVEADNLKQRLSRKAFYGRCGMRTLDYSVMVMGVEMEVLTFGCDVGFEEYHAVYRQVFGEEIGAQIRRVSGNEEY